MESNYKRTKTNLKKCTFKLSILKKIDEEGITPKKRRENRTALMKTAQSLMTCLCLANNFNEKLTKDLLPFNLTHLYLGFSFNQVIQRGVIPGGLEHLDLGSSFNQELVPGAFPTGLKLIIFGYCFNKQLTEGAIPDTVETLHFDNGKFNKVIEKNQLPNSLRNLRMGSNYNQPFDDDVLPSGLRNISLGICYTYPIHLPSGIRYAEIGGSVVVKDGVYVNKQ